MRKYFIGLAVALWAPAAFAQTAEPAPKPSKPPPTAEEIAAARAEADRLIAEAKVESWFENITSEALPTVRHRPSGLVCTFEPGADFNSIGTYAGAAPGENVSCHTNPLGFDISYYAARYSARPTLEKSFDDNIKAMRARFPSLRPYTGSSVTISSPGLPRTLHAKFQFDGQTGPQYTGLTVALVDGWTLKLRASGPLAEAQMVQLMEATTWTAKVMAFMKARRG